MKKNITINLCGRLFQIDEDAYELLQQYIESLRQSFGRQEDGNEIVNDIEARIAELFDELRQQGIEAITIDHVKDIITRIGKPEELAGEDDERKDEGNEGHRYDSFNSAAQGFINKVRAKTAGKRLFRNPNDRMLAGVLSGFAAYTGTDVTWWRIGYVLLVLGSNIFLFPLFKLFHIGGFFFTTNITFILLYFVLAIAMPTVSTPKEMLEMKGKDVTPQNLADVVIDENKPAPQRRGCLASFFSVIMTIFAGIFIFVAATCGLSLLVCLFLIIVSIVIAFTIPAASNWDLPFAIGNMNLPELINVHPWVVITFILGLLLTLFIPLYAIGHMLLTKAGKTQPMGIAQRIIWIVLWVASLCCMIPSLIWIHEKESERYHAEYTKTHTYQGVVMSNDDRDYLRRGGWTLLKHENCAHYTQSGEYYNGDYYTRYLDAWNENCQEVYQAERKEAVKPGIYQLSCIARAEGPGPCIYAIGAEKHLMQIPVYGNKGGELAEQIRQQLTDSLTVATGSPVDKKQSQVRMIILGMQIEVNDDELRINDEVVDQHRIKEGMGWSVVTIDNIVVTGDSITYGVSTDAAFTGQPCRAQWFSATDFKLTRVTK
ncbi:MAG: PspC domain-containing protein [Prevotella sp.]|nr:PspC domain-containing protein [Prevotella sp.]